MRVGTLIRLDDGREGRTVYHGPDGYGIKFDLPPLTHTQVEQIQSWEAGDEWEPDLMLKDYEGEWEVRRDD